MTEYIEKQAAIEYLMINMGWHDEDGRSVDDAEEKRGIITDLINGIPPADVRPVPPGGIGEMSDGYHTFNGLYYQRKVLFASLVNAYKENAWKSYRHEDGELCFGGGWFIVGVETPEGNYTYHYENKDFDLFDCKELSVAPHWDGHTEGDVTRLLSLPDVRPVVRGRWKDKQLGPWGMVYATCSACKKRVTLEQLHRNFCANCGADMRDGDAE